MGSKFASIHVFNTDKETVTNCLAICQLDRTNQLSDAELMEMFGDKNDIASLIQALKGVAVERTLDFYLVESHGWVSVYSEQFSFETVKEYACRYFGEINNPVLTVGYFDDDVLEIACLSAGKIVTAFTKGPGLDAYGLELTNIDLKLFADCFHEDQAKLQYAFVHDDIGEICVALGNQLNIPLHLKLRDIKHKAEHVTFNI